MRKIENDHQLQVSRKAIERLERAFKGYQAHDPEDAAGCLASLRIGIRKIEREIEEYLAEKAIKISEKKEQPKPHLVHSASTDAAGKPS